MKTHLLLILIFFTSAVIAQQTPHNLVPNPSFETIEKRVKGAGEIERAIPWRSITGNPVDLYHKDARDNSFGVPENGYGEEKAKSGNAYAGVSFFGFRGRMPRTYLGTKLTSPLVEGKSYCLKFHISMADLAQYAVNNIAMYITQDSVVEASEDELSFNPQLVPMPNKVYDQQFLWKEICDQYVAKGGEQHIIIGNFRKDNETTNERVRKPRDIPGRQQRNAYYFIDDVSVIPMDQLKEGECACNLIAGGRMEVEKRKFGTEEKERSKAKKTYFVNTDGSKADESVQKHSSEKAKKATESPSEGSKTNTKEVKWSVETTNIFFETDKFKPNAAQEEKLDKVVAYLKDNPSVKIQVIGHMDPSESVKFLGKRRGFMIQKKIIDKGIDKARTSYISKESEEAMKDKDSSKNQRVSFKLQ